MLEQYFPLAELEDCVRGICDKAAAQSLQAEVVCDYSKGFTLTSRRGALENLLHHDEVELSIVLYGDQTSAQVTISDISPSSVKMAFDKARDMMRYTGQDPFAGLPPRERLAYSPINCQQFYPDEKTVEEMIPQVIEMDQQALAADARIKHSDGTLISKSYDLVLVANTEDFLVHAASSDYHHQVSLVAEEAQDKQQASEYCLVCDPSTLIAIGQLVNQAVAKVTSQLNPQKLSTRNCPVIFNYATAKSILGHFLSAISGGAHYRKTTFLLNRLGERVMPEPIKIYQQPHLLATRGSASFDAEGVLTSEQVYVDEGHFSQYLLNSYSARKLGLQTTGNAGGVYNLKLSPLQPGGLPALLKQMDTGLLVTELIGQGINVTTGNYSRGASGFWVEHGQIQYPVSEITVASSLQEMFKGIVAMADDVDCRSSVHAGSLLIEQMTVAGI